MQPVVLGPKVPQAGITCPACSYDNVYRTMAHIWHCVGCGRDFVMYRSGKVYKLVDSVTYWARFK